MALLIAGCTAWEVTGRNPKKDETPHGVFAPAFAH